MKKFIGLFLMAILLVCVSCRVGAEKKQDEVSQTPVVVETPTPLPTPIEKGLSVPNWKTHQPEIEKTDEPIGKIDFANFTYQLPKGWQSAEQKEIKLENGKFPYSKESAGFFLKEVKFGDLTGDGKSEAIVVLGVVTGGLTNMNIVYIMQTEEPNIMWFFETGDRSDGGLKDVRAENGMLYVEFFSKDRYIFQQKETQEVADDMHIPPCCPNFYTKSRYKWNGKAFVIQGKWESLPYEVKK